MRARGICAYRPMLYLALAVLIVAPARGLVVSVVDRALDSPISGATVRVTRGGVELASGLTGANGKVALQGIGAGNVTISCERDGYLRKPETKSHSIGSKSDEVLLTLLASSGPMEYYEAAGKKIQAEANALPSEKRAEFLRSEVARSQELTQESRTELLAAVRTDASEIRASDFPDMLQAEPPEKPRPNRE